MLKSMFLVLATLTCTIGTSATAEVKIADAGTPLAVIVLDENAPAVERYAAEELSRWLKEITGAEFAITHPGDSVIDGKPMIAVGPAAALSVDAGIDLSFDQLGHEGIVIRTVRTDLILTGAEGADRGTLYAVYTLLDKLGMRWWTPTETHIPSSATLTVSDINITYRPTFEYRDLCTLDAMNHEWAARNRSSGSFVSAIPPEKGGQVTYAETPKYFVHTFDTLVPHQDYGKDHPEWFAESDGKRQVDLLTQLCLTNTELLEFVKQRVREVAAAAPKDTDVIISVSQNDNSSPCQCARCLAVDAEEGSPAGTLLRFVNAIADDIATDYPRVAIDTLAYRYTRKAPRITRPRDNVIVRLCSIECSFSQPMTHAVNKAFASDLREWSAISNRLYVWDYVTNFSHYVHPHPNLHVLGPNVQFFAQHHVKGVMEQGNLYSPGGDFTTLKQWVLAQLLWDPSLDGGQLIARFVDEYYGAAAPDVARYIELRREAVGETYVGYCDPFDSPWLLPEHLAEWYELLQQAAHKVENDPVIAGRVELLEAPVLYAIVRNRFREQAWETLGRPWPLKQTFTYYLDELARIVQTHGITAFNEQRTNVPAFLESLRIDVPNAKAPVQVKQLARRDWYDLQDFRFALPGEQMNRVARRKDPSASDGYTATMRGDSQEWDVQASIDTLSLDTTPDEIWTVYAAIRVDVAGNGKQGNAFSAGVYDVYGGEGILPRVAIPLSQIKDGSYHLYRVGTTTLSNSKMFWIAPPSNPQVTSVSVDRLLFIRGDVTLPNTR